MTLRCLLVALVLASCACRAGDAPSASGGPLHDRDAITAADTMRAPLAQSDARTTPPEPAEPRQHGISVRWYFTAEPTGKLCLLVPGQTPNVSRILETLDFESDADGKLGELESTFMTVADGWLDVPVAGQYVLRLESDDGARLALDGAVVIDHDGLHPLVAKDQELELAAGPHALYLEHFQDYGGFGVSLSWKRPGSNAFEIVPHENLWCPRGEVRVTAPGPKKVIRPLERGSPGDGMPLDGVHPSYALATIRPDGFEPKVGGIAWLPDGRMLVSTWDSVGAVYVLDGVQQADRSKIKVARFAYGLAEPLGLATAGTRVFVLQKQELSELVDQDGDGTADLYRSLCSAWDVSPNFHEFAFGLVEKDGWLYFNLAIAIDPGGRSTRPQVPGRGSTLRVRIEDGALEVVAHGERTPNGIGLGPGAEIFVTDNQGDWLPSSKLLRLEKGAFYGSRAVLLDAAASLAVTPPVLWLPQNEIGNSPSTPALIPPGHGPYSGQMCHGDVTYGGVQRDFLEVVDGVWQGCVFPWTQGLEAGVNRISFGPDGALYVGGIGSTGNWSQEGKRKFGLQRLEYTGAPCFEMQAIRALSNGFEIEFTEPLAEGVGWESENYEVLQWRYVPTEQYGGPKIDEEELAVRSASISADRRKAFLEIEGLAEDHVVHVHLAGPIVAESGRALWTTEGWYTLNRIPKDAAGIVAKDRPRFPQNVLSEAERAAGWKLLFDGRTTDSWQIYGKPGMPVTGWEAKDGVLVRTGAAGDLVTTDLYEDFELSLEWKITPGGNSGIFYGVADGHGAVWETGPEMQVLDDAQHPDGRNPLTSAGACYALYAPSRGVTRPVGLFNQARIAVHGGHVEHSLNGVRIAAYDLGSTQWNELVAASKFASMPDFGRARRGRIALQDHGDPVEFRNVKIRPIAP